MNKGFRRRTTDVVINQYGPAIIADLEGLINEAVRSEDDVRLLVLDRILQGVEAIFDSAGSSLSRPPILPFLGCNNGQPNWSYTNSVVK